MKKAVWMVEADHQYQIWLFTEYSTRLERRICRLKEHEQLRCPKCGKIDEFKALRMGVSPKVKVAAKMDVVGTREDWTLVSERFKRLVEKHKIKGADFAPLPGSPGYYAYIPTLLVPVDQKLLEKEGMSFEGKCGTCGRYREISGGWPTRRCMRIPDGELFLFDTDTMSECTLGRRTNICTSETVQKIFENNGITGVDSYMSLEDQV